MRKTLVIAVREYQAAVRTKTFGISLVIMPVMASAGLVAAILFKDVVNIQDKRIAVIDRTGVLFGHLAEAADQYNRTQVLAPDEHTPGRLRQVKARFVLERVEIVGPGGGEWNESAGGHETGNETGSRTGRAGGHETGNETGNGTGRAGRHGAGHAGGYGTENAGGNGIGYAGRHGTGYAGGHGTAHETGNGTGRAGRHAAGHPGGYGAENAGGNGTRYAGRHGTGHAGGYGDTGGEGNRNGGGNGNGRWDADAVVGRSRAIGRSGAAGRAADERAVRYATLDEARIDLSDRVRRGELTAFVEIGAETTGARAEGQPSAGDQNAHGAGMAAQPCPLVLCAPGRVVYHSNNPIDRAFVEWLDGPVQSAVRAFRLKAARLPAEAVAWATRPVPIEHDALYSRSAAGSALTGRKSDNYVHIAAGMGMALLLSMVVLVGAMPLTYSVLEEKIQRSAEVLLGSATPFQFMMGKLLGMVGVSLSIVTIYLVVGFFTADHFGYGDTLPRHLINWFVLYQAAAVFMFGSIYIAIGAACNDMKDAQNLMTPASLIACLPLFLIRPVMLEPDGTFATWMSFFPPATPTLMLLRQSLPAPVPSWQPAVGLLLVVAAAVFCVAVAGRIFRIGILMQGKGANLRELFRWAFTREGRSRQDRLDRRRHHDQSRTRTWQRSAGRTPAAS